MNNNNIETELVLSLLAHIISPCVPLPRSIVSLCLDLLLAVSPSPCICPSEITRIVFTGWDVMYVCRCMCIHTRILSTGWAVCFSMFLSQSSMFLCVGFSLGFGCSLGRRVIEGGRKRKAVCVKERERESTRERRGRGRDISETDR
jgi:hypothetical protein